MSDLIEFFVAGVPVAQGRGRIIRIGNHAAIKDPEKSKEWKQYVKLVASQYAPDVLFSGPMYLSCSFLMQRPKADKKAWFHTKRGDLDNHIKGIMDSLSGVIYEDDKQVAFICASKRYAMPDMQEKPGVIVRVKEMEE